MFKYQLRSAGGMPGHKKGHTHAATTELDLPIMAATTDGSGTAIVQANLQLSKMNNRLYRQLRDYHVSFSVAAPGGITASTVDYRFWTLPNTWFVKGAIEHAYLTYMQCMADELNAGIRMARWHDFSINEQDVDGVYDYMNVCLFDGDGWATLSADETITDSTVKNTSGTSMGFNLMGNESNSFNIFNEYAKVLNYGTPDDESVSSDQPYTGLLDLEDADVLAERGDRAPYDRDFTSFLHDGTDDQNILVQRDYLVVDRDGGPAKTRTKSFVAPLGLVWVQKLVAGSATDFVTNSPELIMHAKPGSYKGVAAPSLV